MKTVEWNEDLARCQENNAKLQKANVELLALYKDARNEIVQLTRLVRTLKSMHNK